MIDISILLYYSILLDFLITYFYPSPMMYCTYRYLYDIVYIVSIRYKVKGYLFVCFQMPHTKVSNLEPILNLCTMSNKQLFQSVRGDGTSSWGRCENTSRGYQLIDQLRSEMCTLPKPIPIGNYRWSVWSQLFISGGIFTQVVSGVHHCYYVPRVAMTN